MMQDMEVGPNALTRWLGIYEPGASSMKVRSARPQISMNPPGFDFRAHPDNYDLYFSELGTLLYSRHYSKSSGDYYIKYAYNASGFLTTTRKFSLPSKQLTETCDFYYDRKKRLIAEKYRYFNTKHELTSRFSNFYVYSHPSGYEHIICDNDCPMESFVHTHVFDSQDRIIEEKSFSHRSELIAWTSHEYSGDTLARSIELDRSGGIESVKEYLSDNDGICTGWHISSPNWNFLREYQYILNSRSHWTTCVTLDDGIPVLYTDRIIKYY